VFRQQGHGGGGTDFRNLDRGHARRCGAKLIVRSDQKAGSAVAILKRCVHAGPTALNAKRSDLTP